MIRTKERFYWKDLLYLSRVRDYLRCVQSRHDEDLFQCTACFSLVRFRLKDPKKQTGQWIRIKPYEYYHLIAAYPAGKQDITQMDGMNLRTETGAELYQCRLCASYWWNEHSEWIRADDELIESNGKD